jgi:hypothetical protein
MAADLLFLNILYPAIVPPFSMEGDQDRKTDEEVNEVEVRFVGMEGALAASAADAIRQLNRNKRAAEAVKSNFQCRLFAVISAVNDIGSFSLADPRMDNAPKADAGKLRRGYAAYCLDEFTERKAAFLSGLS